MSNLEFEYASGTVLGRDHLLDGKNNQDAMCVLEDGGNLIVVVSDGCGESKHSEVGATIGSHFTAHTINRMLKRGLQYQSQILLKEGFWESVRGDILSQIRILANQMGDSLSSVISEYFLFTLVGAVVTPEISVFFSLGDGTLIVNGTRYQLGSFSDNAPPYIGYGIVNTTREFASEDLKFRVQLSLPTGSVTSFVIGTDGIDDYLKAQDRALPGSKELVGPIELLWKTDRFFTNRSALQRRLNLANREVSHPDWQKQSIERHPGLLHDDTTMVVVRRKGEATNA